MIVASARRILGFRDSQLDLFAASTIIAPCKVELFSRMYFPRTVEWCTNDI